VSHGPWGRKGVTARLMPYRGRTTVEGGTMTTFAGDRYVVISSDGHAGGQVHEYREHLERRWHEDFDAWLATYVNPWTDLRGETAYRNWDSAARLRELEDDGVVAEVLFPNTIPPFFPSGNLLARPPEPDEYEHRWAGLRAHNRWLAEFCAHAPGRRAGMAQIFLNDVDDAVAEIEWAAEHGLFGGILLPGVPPDSGLPPLHAPHYDPIWAACQDLALPVNNHSGAAGPAPGMSVAGMAVFMIELGWFSHRVFWHMALGGVFARYPRLKLVLTEQSCGWVPAVLAMLDHQYARFGDPRTAESHFGGALLATVPEPPSAYWARNAWAGASFLRPPEAALRHEIGVDRIMWGQDYPHIEGTYPHTTEALRHTFAGIDPGEVARMVGLNAAEVYGFDLAALAPIAERVGPSIAAVDVPLDRIPEDSRSIAFAGEGIKPW
jgi:predicted TIM-barrel fold metal-dependent hydrolase